MGNVARRLRLLVVLPLVATAAVAWIVIGECSPESGGDPQSMSSEVAATDSGHSSPAAIDRQEVHPDEGSPNFSLSFVVQDAEAPATVDSLLVLHPSGRLERIAGPLTRATLPSPSLVHVESAQFSCCWIHVKQNAVSQPGLVETALSPRASVSVRVLDELGSMLDGIPCALRVGSLEDSRRLSSSFPYSHAALARLRTALGMLKFAPEWFFEGAGSTEFHYMPLEVLAESWPTSSTRQVYEDLASFLASCGEPNSASSLVRFYCSLGNLQAESDKDGSIVWQNVPQGVYRHAVSSPHVGAFGPIVGARVMTTMAPGPIARGACSTEFALSSARCEMELVVYSQTAVIGNIAGTFAFHSVDHPSTTESASVALYHRTQSSLPSGELVQGFDIEQSIQVGPDGAFAFSSVRPGMKKVTCVWRFEDDIYVVNELFEIRSGELKSLGELRPREDGVVKIRFVTPDSRLGEIIDTTTFPIIVRRYGRRNAAESFLEYPYARIVCSGRDDVIIRGLAAGKWALRAFEPMVLAGGEERSLGLLPPAGLLEFDVMEGGVNYRDVEYTSTKKRLVHFLIQGSGEDLRETSALTVIPVNTGIVTASHPLQPQLGQTSSGESLVAVSLPPGDYFVVATSSRGTIGSPVAVALRCTVVGSGIQDQVALRLASGAFLDCSVLVPDDSSVLEVRVHPNGEHGSQYYSLFVSSATVEPSSLGPVPLGSLISLAAQQRTWTVLERGTTRLE